VRLAPPADSRGGVEDLRRDGLQRPGLTSQRLCAWEHSTKVRLGDEYLDRLCRVYQTCPDKLGFGHDYTPAAEPTRAKPVAYEGQERSTACSGAHTEPDSQEAATDRSQFLRALGMTGLAAVMGRSGRASA
jgi:hypothetical protein